MKIFKIVLATAVFSAVAGGAAVGTSEHIISEKERQKLRSERRETVVTEAYTTRFGKTKYRHRKTTVDGYGREVK